MTAPLIHNEPQLHFALTQFFHNQDELDNRARNDDPLDRLDHATYLADRSELRVLLRNRCLRSTVAAGKAGKTGLVHNLWEAVHQLNVQRFEEEVLYQRHNSRPRGPDPADWLAYHAGIEFTAPQNAQIVAHFESPEIVRAAPLPNPFNGTTPDNFARQHTPALSPAPAALPPPLTPTGVPDLPLILPPSATRNAQGQPQHDHPVIPALDLPAEADRGPPEYALLPADRPLTPRWFVRVRDRLRYARPEHQGTVQFQAILERLRRQAGQPQPEPEPEPEQQQQQLQQPAEQRRQQPQRGLNRPPVVDLILADQRPLRKFLNWYHFLFCWAVATPVLLIIALVLSFAVLEWTEIYYDEWLHKHGGCIYGFTFHTFAKSPP